MPTSPAELYLDLVKRVVLNTVYRDPTVTAGADGPYEHAARLEGRDWPRDAHSMMGAKRMDNLHWACRTVVSEGVEGDFLEAGVWRGGAGIFMRAALAAYGDDSRRVLLADSFEGLPKPNPELYPADAGDAFWTFPQLAVSIETVRENFERYGLLDDRVVFLKGWFKDTLPITPTDRIALLRLDGDMYESTWQALEALYPKCAPGAVVIIDDYGCVEACRTAVTEFRARHGIDAPIETVDWTGVYWRVPR